MEREIERQVKAEMQVKYDSISTVPLTPQIARGILKPGLEAQAWKPDFILSEKSKFKDLF